MPFSELLHDGAVGAIDFHSRSVPAHGHALSGDGLWMETGRPEPEALFLLVDVMGHGSPAAAVVTLLDRQMLRDPHCQKRSPTDLIHTLHGMLQPLWAGTQRFVAALALLVNGQTGVIEGCAAGLPFPVVGRPGCNWSLWRLPAGGLLGVPMVGAFVPATTQLEPEQMLLAFTDGVIEAGAPSAQFGYERLITFLRQLPPGMSGAEVLRALFGALQQHEGANWPRDDTTALCLTR